MQTNDQRSSAHRSKRPHCTDSQRYYRERNALRKILLARDTLYLGNGSEVLAISSVSSTTATSKRRSPRVARCRWRVRHLCDFGRRAWETLIAARKAPRSFLVSVTVKNRCQRSIGPFEHTRSVIYLDHGEMAVLTADGYRVRSLDVIQIDKPVNQIEWDLQNHRARRL